jgi:hypothetical protein
MFNTNSNYTFLGPLVKVVVLALGGRKEECNTNLKKKSGPSAHSPLSSSFLLPFSFNLM